MKIGIISDTHVPVRSRAVPGIVFEIFRDVDHIIHAGDLVSFDVVSDLEALAPVTAVAGNVDSFYIYEKLGEKKIVTLGRFNFGVYHGHGGSRGNTIERVLKQFEKDNVDCIVFGHSHTPYCGYHNGVLLFNPGSPTDRRGNIYFSVGILETDAIIKPKIVYFNLERVVREEYV